VQQRSGSSARQLQAKSQVERAVTMQRRVCRVLCVFF